jgi:hypothetical protein
MTMSPTMNVSEYVKAGDVVRDNGMIRVLKRQRTSIWGLGQDRQLGKRTTMRLKHRLERGPA